MKWTFTHVGLWKISDKCKTGRIMEERYLERNSLDPLYCIAIKDHYVRWNLQYCLGAPNASGDQ